MPKMILYQALFTKYCYLRCIELKLKRDEQLQMYMEEVLRFFSLDEHR